MSPDELSERDRAHFDDLCERSGGDDGGGYRIPGPDDVTPSPPPDPDEDATAARYALIELGGVPPDQRIDHVAVARNKDERIRELEQRLARTEDAFRAYQGSLLAAAPLLAWDETDGHAPHRCGTQVLVSMHSRSVRCRACGAELEPMDVLRAYAKGERQFVQHVDSLVQRRRDLDTEVRKLTDLKNSLRSSVRKKGVDPDRALAQERQGIEALRAERKRIEADLEVLRDRALKLRTYIERNKARR